MPFKSDRQRRYLYSQEPDVAEKFASEEYDNSGGAYPAPPNFNPGGDDAEMLRQTDGGIHRVDGTGANHITDHGDPDEVFDY